MKPRGYATLILPLCIGLCSCVVPTSPRTSSSSSNSTVTDHPFSSSPASTIPPGSGDLLGTQLNGALELDTYGRNIVDVFSLLRPSVPRALTNSSGGSTSYFPNYYFYLSKPVLGYDVYRSTDDSTWTNVARVNLGALTSSNSSSPLTYTDVDPSLSLGTTYYYEIQGFDSSGFSPASASAGAAFLPPFTLSLVDSIYTAASAPTTEVDMTALSAYPLKFAISNTALWSPASAANYFFYFSLLISDMVGGASASNGENYSPAFYGEFRYDFSTGKFEAPTSYNSTYGYANAVVPGGAWTGSRAIATGIAYQNGGGL